MGHVLGGEAVGDGDVALCIPRGEVLRFSMLMKGKRAQKGWEEVIRSGNLDWGLYKGVFSVWDPCWTKQEGYLMMYSTRNERLPQCVVVLCVCLRVEGIRQHLARIWRTRKGRLVCAKTRREGNLAFQGQKHLAYQEIQ